MSSDTLPGAVARPQPHALVRLSNRIAVLESWLAGTLMLGVFGLLTANVISRALTRPLIWSDELAIYLMIWTAFVGASLGLAQRHHVAVTLLPDALPQRARQWLALAVDIALLVFFAVLAVTLWWWFDPITLWRIGSVDAFSAKTFNFIYQEPTTTLGIRKVWFWLVLPLFCVTGVIHVLASLAAHLAGEEGQD